MTRSPLQAASRISHNDDRRRATKTSSMQREDSSRIQRERLTRDVLSRQQSSDIRSTQDTTVAGPIVTNLTPEQMYSNFEEWIKMATDNKINANNSWNFALIDYFHELTFLRDGDSINFQKASVSLDGCVKIYTSRVDSVATETGKLLSGLADSGRDGDEEDELQSTSERRVRKRGNRAADSTLLTSFSSIALKKFDLDFAVDPLFKKTSADFDEGGARGLLLNHLSLDRECKIIFDASDASNADPESDKTELEDITHDDDHMDADGNQIDNDSQHEEQQQPTETSQHEEEQPQPTETSQDDPMDVDNDGGAQPENEHGSEPQPTADEQQPNAIEESQQSQKEILVEISRLKARMPDIDALKDLQICPSLQGYNFFSETDLNMPSLDHDEPGNILDGNVNLPNDNMDLPDFGVQDGFDDDFAVDFFDYDDGGPMDSPDDPLMGEDDRLMGGENDSAGNEPALHEEDFLGALMNDDGNELFSYFDSTFAKNWAGPEHWKLRRPVSKIQSKPTTETDSHDGGETSRKKSRQGFQIDFLEGEDVDEEELFAPDKPARITISTGKEAAVEDKIHVLPDDMHFSSKQLLRLFLKPRSVMWGRKKPRREETEAEQSPAPPPQDDYDGGFDDFDFGPDTQYWADQQIDDTPADDEPPATDASMADQTFLSGYDDSFYHDSYYEAYDDPETSQYGDPLITNHRLKKSKPLYVNYARTAKRVDVKKLKENLWKVLVSNKRDVPDRMDQENEGDDEKVEGVQRFTDVLHDLRRLYHPKVFRDISVPFCFICLLHLANERNLTIGRSSSSNEDDDDDDDEDNFVLGETPMDEKFLNELTIVQNV
ncbi:hypothetical protein O0I10_001889 [Lichtheimia ornata]|uniref:Condensin complex subunit 2 n=1 Tax=Lichtheimia ornata TaxID=688661 RepID=A0AAD7Y1Y8_9FUNG|nr:uncharacterized protein O0I10_001889 [Lichtheimia ornata]KAJ8662196.1 hypothetical protein O0I10_001889 [Lichtheimia ornata]